MKKIFNEIKSVFWFVVVFILAIALIENQSSNFLVEMAGDLFGAGALVSMGIYYAITNED